MHAIILGDQFFLQRLAYGITVFADIQGQNQQRAISNHTPQQVLTHWPLGDVEVALKV